MKHLSACTREAIALCLVMFGITAMFGSVALGKTTAATVCLALAALVAFVGVYLIPNPAELEKERAE